MGDHIDTFRSNAFLVKDPAAFCAWADALDLEVITNDHWSPVRLGIVCHAIYPTVRYDPDTGEAEEMNFEHELAAHLQADQVAILKCVSIVTESDQRVTSVTGWASAINANGDTHEILLDDIIALAKTLLPDGVAADTLSMPD